MIKRRQRLNLILILLILGLALASLSVPKVYAPSTVGTSTQGNAMSYSFQKKTFYINSLYWVFWSDGTNLVYSTASDGYTWATKQTWRAGVSFGHVFSVAFDGVYVHYAYTPTIGNNLYYRRGIPNSNGTITSATAEQTIVPSTNEVWLYPGIIVDSGSHVWIGYNTQDALDANKNRPEVIRNTNTDGTWATTVGFPYILRNVNSTDYWWVTPVKLQNERVYVAYVTYGIIIRGNLYSAGWTGEESASTVAIDTSYSLSSINDDVHMAFDEGAGNIYYRKRTYGVGWGAETLLYPGSPADLSTGITADTSNGKIWVWWVGAPNSNHIYYIQYSGSAWGSVVDWQDESGVAIPNLHRFSVFTYVMNNRLGMSYCIGNSPYTIRFSFIGPAPASTVDMYGTGTSTLLAYFIDGDLLGFTFAAYTTTMGMSFYGLLLGGVSILFYNRTKSIAFLSVMWLLLGGIFTLWFQVFSPLAVILMALGLTGVVYRLFDTGTS